MRKIDQPFLVTDFITLRRVSSLITISNNCGGGGILIKYPELCKKGGGGKFDIEISILSKIIKILNPTMLNLNLPKYYKRSYEQPGPVYRIPCKGCGKRGPHPSSGSLS